MNTLYKNIFLIFLAIVISNVLVDTTDGNYSIVNNPIRFFVSAIVLSIIGGYFVNKINQKN